MLLYERKDRVEGITVIRFVIMLCLWFLLLICNDGGEFGILGLKMLAFCRKVSDFTRCFIINDGLFNEKLLQW